MDRLHFFKGQALGNDYLVVDAAETNGAFSTAQAVHMCDRHRGAGSDGVLLADLSAHPVHLRIINPDGTEAEKSGNGLRIFAAYLYHRRLVRRDEWFNVRLARDTVAMRVEDELDDGAVMVRVQMGPASFDAADVAFTGLTGEALDHELALPAGGTVRVNTVSLGNPHCVVFVDVLERDEFLRVTPQLCTHPAFARGTNVQMARVSADGTIEAWIWERGAGETLASGSSACAVASAAVRRGLVPAGTHAVQMQGGTAQVTVGADYQVELLGPAQVVYEGWMI